ncbi:MAG: DUF86 domain-containing protein [bacterium]
MKDDLVYLRHILDAILAAEEFCKPGRDAFMNDRKTRDAVVRNIEVIGEAAKNVSEGFRQTHADIPWHDMAAMRDKVIHQYFGVKFELVWDTVSDRLPGLRIAVEAILRTQP